MIVNRRTFIAKKGRMEEAIGSVKEAFDKFMPSSVSRRYYSSNIAPLDTFGVEIECESLAEYERIVAEYFARVTPDIWAKWFELTEIGGTNEIWDLV
jgi:hypothetical protein